MSLNSILGPVSESRNRRQKDSQSESPHQPKGIMSEFQSNIDAIAKKILSHDGDESWSEEKKRDHAKFKDIFKNHVSGLYDSFNIADEFLSPDEFQALVLEHFTTGLTYFIKIDFLRFESQELIPGKRTHKVHVYGKEGKQTRKKDERSIAEQLEDYIERLPRFEGRDDKLEAFTIEQIEIFSIEYFKMLNEALRRTVPLDTALHMAEHVYSYGSVIFEEMRKSPYELSADLVAQVCRQYPVDARNRFEALATVGKRLEKEYWHDPENPSTQQKPRKQWVAGPLTIRNFTIQYPTTIEKGVTVVDRELDSLVTEFGIPKDVIIRACISEPDTYRNRLDEIRNSAEVLMGMFKDATSTIEIFREFDVQNIVYSMVARMSRGRCIDKLDRARHAFVKILGTEKAAEKKGDIQLGKPALRRVLRTLMLEDRSPGGIKEVVKEERDRARQREKLAESTVDNLFEKAEDKDLVFGQYYVLFGDGESFEEIWEEGAVFIDLVREQYGETEGELFLAEGARLLQAYADQIVDAEKKKALDESVRHSLMLDIKDMIISDRYDPVDFFTRVLRKPWPDILTVVEPATLLEEVEVGDSETA